MASVTRVMVDVNRVAAIRRGINGTDSPVAVDLDVSTMSQEDRDDVGRTLAVAGGVGYLRALAWDTCMGREYVGCNTERRAVREGVYVDVPIHLLPVEVPTQDGVIEALAAQRFRIAAARAQREAADAAKAAAARDATAAVLAERRTTTSRQIYDRAGKVSYYKCYAGADKSEPAWPYPADESIQESAEARAWQAELDALNAAARDAAIAAQAAADQEAARERADWIEAHGSQRLRRLVAEGIAHERTYEAEHAEWEAAHVREGLAAQRPGWQPVPREGIDLAIADVGTRALALLDMARQIAPTARLARLKSTGKYVAVEVFLGRWIYWPRD